MPKLSPIPASTPLPKLAQADRLNIILQVSHEHRGEQPFGINCVYTEMLQTMEQPYTRRITATEEWQPLDLGWLSDNTGTVVIENLEGKSLSVQPTDKERKETEKKIIELAFSENETDEYWIIKPGGFFLGQPSRVASLQYRCQSGTAKCKITAFSK